MDFTFYKNNDIVVSPWNDNSVVISASNHEPIESIHSAQRKDRKMKTIEMPKVLKAYNQRIGGVDLFDNPMNNYRIGLRGKEWYLPLFTNVLDSAMMNA